MTGRSLEWAGDGTLAWRVLRQVGDYVDTWERHAASSAVQAPEPFRIRVQSKSDIEAARFELLAWEDPSGPGPPFWRQDRMAEAVLNLEAMPLAAIPDQDGTVDALRPLCGDLVVRVGYGAASVLVRVRDAPRFPDDGGLAQSSASSVAPATAQANQRIGPGKAVNFRTPRIARSGPRTSRRKSLRCRRLR